MTENKRYEIQRDIDRGYREHATYKVLDKTQHVGDNQIVCAARWRNAVRIVEALSLLDKATETKDSYPTGTTITIDDKNWTVLKYPEHI